MKLLDGKRASKIILSQISHKISRFINDKLVSTQPKIGIIQIGDNPSSINYLKSKIKIASDNNIQTQLYFFSDLTSESELLSKIDMLNKSNDIDGYIVQLPLQNHISQEKVINAIDPEKDLDGFHPINFGKMALGQKSHRPATAYGILKLLEFYDIQTQGKHVVVIGRSNIVGKPLSIMLGNDFNIGKATVTTCDINTPADLLKEQCLKADIVIVAVGKPNLLTEDMVKEGAIVIDVGINEINGTIVGDCDFDNVSPKCDWITPVPGGVGPMTTCALFINAYNIWRDKNNLSESQNLSKNYSVSMIETIDTNFCGVGPDMSYNFKKGRKFIGTYDHYRKPNEDEIIQIIGDYPVSEQSLITNNPSYRHYRWALKYDYDSFEGHPCWDKIDQVWIINDESRKDRLHDTLKELKKAGIPLNKVKIQPAQSCNSTGNKYTNGLIGCFRSHLRIFEQLISTDFKNVLIFEDDFTFSDPIEETHKQIETFFERDYDYDVLLFSTSSMGTIEHRDDLISISKQPCTTTAGYMISQNGLDKVFPLWLEGINGLLQTCDFNRFACDRYWNKIQKDEKMMVFNRKIGYQKPSYSTTLGILSYNLD